MPDYIYKGAVDPFLNRDFKKLDVFQGENVTNSPWFLSIHQVIHTPKNYNDKAILAMCTELLSYIEDYHQYMVGQRRAGYTYTNNSAYLMFFCQLLSHMGKREQISAATILKIIQKTLKVVNGEEPFSWRLRNALRSILRNSKLNAEKVTFLLSNFINDQQYYINYQRNTGEDMGLSLFVLALIGRRDTNKEQIDIVLKKFNKYNWRCLIKNSSAVFDEKATMQLLFHEDVDIRREMLKRQKDLSPELVAKLYANEKSGVWAKEYLGKMLDKSNEAQALGQHLQFLKLRGNDRVMRKTSLKIRRKVVGKVLSQEIN